MKRTALLIGCQTHGLSGVISDIETMTGLLSARGFSCDVRVGDDATRRGIIDSLARLARDAAADDAVVLYYSGHGGLAINPFYGNGRWADEARPSSWGPRFYQYIVPTDHGFGEAFRGVFTAELTAHLNALTARTRNVTAILDCCHAGGMVKDAAQQIVRKSLPIPWRDGVGDHIEWLLSQGYELAQFSQHVEGNPHVLRLVACTPSQSAYEFTDERGRRNGLLTHALARALHEVGRAAITWDALSRRVAALAREQIGAQHPTVEGPRGRELFSVAAQPRQDVLSYARQGDWHTLSGGTLHGVGVGDRYLIMPLDASKADPGRALARAVVTGVAGHCATVELTARDPALTIPEGACAYLHRASRPIAVAMALAPALRRRIEAALAAADIELAASDSAEPIAHVASDGATLELRDHLGHLMTPPVDVAALDEQGLRSIACLIDQVGRAKRLTELVSGVGRHELREPLDVEWGRVVDGAPARLPARGAELCEGDAIYVRVRNNGGVALFSSVLGVGVSRSIRLLSAGEPLGVEVDPCGGEYTLGEGVLGQLHGIPLHWPASLPRERPRPCCLVVVTHDMRADLRSLESGFESLEELAGDVPVHKDFTVSAAFSPRMIRYRVDHIEFNLVPRERAATTGDKE